MSMKDILSEDTFREQWKSETTHICEIQTYRHDDIPNSEVNGRLIEIRDYFDTLTSSFNEGVTTTKFIPFQWCANIREGTDGTEPEDLISTTKPNNQVCLDSDFWIFGYRFGATEPEDRICIICHLDTVPATEGDEWAPFIPHVEEREYTYKNSESDKQPFLVGRGCVDDKGPAISALMAARKLAKDFDNDPRMEKTMVEIIFDTSEETNMSTPRYLEDPKTNKPHFGVVYDAQWCVRAEKGCERPIFKVPASTQNGSRLYIEKITTSANNSTNTIPDSCIAVIKGPGDELSKYADMVEDRYASCPFDDESYRRAPLEAKVLEAGGVVRLLSLETTILGAQHGSAPQENRDEGANPLVSLANFLAAEVRNGKMEINDYATVSDFISWMWGTQVFGEKHAPMEEDDTVFEKGNGTTYAVTKISEDKDGLPTLEVDIRYAIPHHETGWDGETEGMLLGSKSRFEGIFSDLVSEFNEIHTQYPEVSHETQTIFAPDIRVPDSNENFKIVEQAFFDVREKVPPRLAIGGGTDAKGFVFLLGVGPLFSTNLGPPINYHGIDEGIPMDDIFESTKILVKLMAEEITSPPKRPSEESRRKSVHRVKALRASGHKFCCNC